jgi:hypothetical protein
MKKITILFTALVFLFGMNALSFAQAAQAKSQPKTEVIKGKIISIDAAKNEIVVKNNKDGVEKTIVVDPKVTPSLKTDEAVKVRVKEGTNIAESVKEIVKTAAPAAKPTGK